MSELAEQAERELTELVTRYAAAEAEVVRAFYASPRTDDEYLDVVLRQAGREAHTALQMTRALRMLEEMERTVDRHALRDQMERQADEIKHYTIMADLAELLAGRKLFREELLKYWVFAVYDPMLPRERMYNPHLPEANAALDFNRRLIEELGWERGRPLTRLAEGGGGGAFVEATLHRADDFQRRFADAMAEIYEDEKGHGPEQIHEYALHRIKSVEQLEEEKRWLTEFLQHHLRVRNEIWRYALSAERMAAIDRGDEVPTPVGALGKR
jgi:hypothetical protein